LVDVVEVRLDFIRYAFFVLVNEILIDLDLLLLYVDHAVRNEDSLLLELDLQLAGVFEEVVEELLGTNLVGLLRLLQRNVVVVDLVPDLVVDDLVQLGPDVGDFGVGPADLHVVLHVLLETVGRIDVVVGEVLEVPAATALGD
jgi:hypothetical protein